MVLGFKKIQEALRNSFHKIREEMDIHLDSINENTNEINANYDYLMKVEGKIDKLNERLDDLQMMLEEVVGIPKKANYFEQFEGIVLNNREQEVFMVLYSSEDSISYMEIAKTLGLTVQLVDRYIDSMIQKNLPIIKKYNEGNILLALDVEFKHLQAKQNVLHISENIVQSLI